MLKLKNHSFLSNYFYAHDDSYYKDIVIWNKFIFCKQNLKNVCLIYKLFKIPLKNASLENLKGNFKNFHANESFHFENNYCCCSYY